MSGVRVALSLGSNLGDRRAHLDWAITHLRTRLTDVLVSPFIETAPRDGAPPPDFLNAALVGGTALEPEVLLAWLQDLERQRGRSRPFPAAPRTLDLDLILYGSRIVRTSGLDVPHPRFRERRFVLEPLAAVAPDMVDPVRGVTVRGLLEELRNREGERTG